MCYNIYVKSLRKRSSIDNYYRDLMFGENQDNYYMNAAFENKLNSMYSLEDVYTIATGELGMVYSENGQIRYYENEQGDYVKQYSDVPETTN